MSTNNLQNILLAIGEFIQPIANTLNKLQKDPETIRLLQNIGYWVSNHDRISPSMEKILTEMEINSNLSEAENTFTYKQIFKLLSDSEDIENTSLFDLINQSYFRDPLLKCFDEIEIGNHFKRRKNTIEEAFKLYELKFYSGCLCLLHSQVEGIITDYLIFKKILRKDIKSGKTVFIVISDKPKEETTTGLKRKLGSVQKSVSFQ